MLLRILVTLLISILLIPATSPPINWVIATSEIAPEKNQDLLSTYILQQKKSWTIKARTPSMMGASIDEVDGMARVIMLPKPYANHWKASWVARAV